MSKKSTKKEITLSGLIEKIEGILETEIDRLPETLDGLTPEKRLEFITKTLPVVAKYRENHPSTGWVEDWGI